MVLGYSIQAQRLLCCNSGAGGGSYQSYKRVKKFFKHHQFPPIKASTHKPTKKLKNFPHHELHHIFHRVLRPLGNYQLFPRSKARIQHQGIDALDKHHPRY